MCSGDGRVEPPSCGLIIGSTLFVIVRRGQDITSLLVVVSAFMIGLLYLVNDLWERNKRSKSSPSTSFLDINIIGKRDARNLFWLWR